MTQFYYFSFSFFFFYLLWPLSDKRCTSTYLLRPRAPPLAWLPPPSSNPIGASRNQFEVVVVPSLRSTIGLIPICCSICHPHRQPRCFILHSQHHLNPRCYGAQGLPVRERGGGRRGGMMMVASSNDPCFYLFHPPRK